MKIYIAAALAEYDLACSVAKRVRFAGHKVVSQWHYEVAVDAPPPGVAPKEPQDKEARKRIFDSNIEDLEQSDMVILLVPEGSRPNCALVELGWALCLDKPVYWYGRTNVADSYITVSIFATVDELIEALNANSGHIRG